MAQSPWQLGKCWGAHLLPDLPDLATPPLPDVVLLPKLSFVQGAQPRPLRPFTGEPMSSSLLMTRRFAPLFWCQFFSAFSDNFLKNSLVFLILFHIGGANAESADHACRRGFHRALFFSVRARRRACRPLRQGEGGAAAQVCRDRRCAPRGARFLHCIRCRCCSSRCFCSA